MAREGGGVGIGMLSGWGGMWAGCAGLAALVSPSLVVPIVGEVTTGGACVVGGIAGGAGPGWLGYLLGSWAGEATYDLERAVAYRHPDFVGDDLTVALDFGEGRVVVVSENDAAWHPVLSALDADPRGRQRSAEWTVALVGGAADMRIELISAASR